MDRLGLQILCRELREDTIHMMAAARAARSRLEEEHPGHLEACGYELNRGYNIAERAFERICLSFENHFEKRGDYHQRLIDRISLDIPGVRPAFLDVEMRGMVTELKGFRHVFRHAYDLRLRRDRLAELVALAEAVAGAMPGLVERFEREVVALLESG